MDEYQKRCQPYSCKINYPNSDCFNPYGKVNSQDSECRPFGYQPKRHNPGGLKFYVYDYPFQTQHGKPLSHPGMGWYRYEKTGKYYTDRWW